MLDLFIDLKQKNNKAAQASESAKANDDEEAVKSEDLAKEDAGEVESTETTEYDVDIKTEATDWSLCYWIFSVQPFTNHGALYFWRNFVGAVSNLSIQD